jgi:phage terminase small subunit
VVAYSRWVAAEQQVGLLGAVVKSPSGFAVANPYVAIAASASRQMRQWGKELGITRTAKAKGGSNSKDANTSDQGGLLTLLAKGKRAK